LQNQLPPAIPAIAVLIISTLLLTLPGSSFPKEDWLSRIWFDKWVHIGMFMVLVILWCRAVFKKEILPGKLKLLFLFVEFLAIVYGVVIEFVQQNWVKNRSFDLGDIAADVVGAALGWIFSIGRYIKK
jgi:VanZ family protein